MTNPANLRAKYMRRPLLIEPGAATEIMARLAAADPRGMKRESRFLASLRKLNIFRPSAMEDDDYTPAEPARPACYTPLWAQQAYGEPEDEGFCWSLYRGAALFEVQGPLASRGDYWCGTWYHGYDTVLAGLRDAAANSRVKAMFIRSDCPGGPVDGQLPQLAAWIRENRAAAGGKPIHLYADMACSAACWAFSPCDRISAPKVGLVGSVGAVYVHEDWSEAYKDMGCVVTPIQFGANKTDGAHWKPLSEQARADIQAEIDQCGRDFVADVEKGRPVMTAERLLATEARVFMADHDDPERSGLALGFVDAIETEEEAFAAVLSAIADKTSVTVTLPAGLGGTATTAQTETAMFNSKGLGAKPKASTEVAPADDTAPVTETNDDDDETDPPSDPAPELEPEAAPAGEANATAIANSPEATSHPHLAMAAIRDGMSLKQLKGQIKAIGNTPTGAKSSQLRDAMAGVKRIGGDAEDAGVKTHSSALRSAGRNLAAKGK